ncbi:MAG: hypothetical protein Q9195_008266 [Heterodermia aff. obscurata]
MTSINGDSSDEETGSFTATNVLLGYASKEPTDDSFSQLGGQPTWPNAADPPSAQLAKCKVCNRMMTLLLQLNGDLPERYPGHERKLYIFACRSKTCKKKAGSIRAMRSVKVSLGAPSHQEETSNGIPQPTDLSPPKPAPMLGDSIFGSKFPPTSSSNSNPFSTSGTSNPNPNPFSTTSTPSPFPNLSSKPPQRPDPSSSSDLPTTFAQKARIASPPPSSPPLPSPREPWPSPSQLPPPYPSYHLDADYETLDNSSSPQPSSSSHNVSIDEDSAGGGSADKDSYESTHDGTFQRFATRLAHNPLQVLRYEFDGAPLLYSKTDAVGKLFPGGARIPRCEHCGQKRVFELQLVPQAITELEVEEVGLEGMEWGTVMLGVCAGDCGGQAGQGWAWREEWVGVQWEEVGGRR